MKTSILLPLLMLVGCSKDDKLQTVKLDKLGLQMDVHGDVKIMDGLMPNSVSISKPRGLNMGVELLEQEAMLEDRKNAVSAIHDPTNLKTDKLPDGWVLTFDGKGPTGPYYDLEAQRTIGGKVYKCSSTVGHQAEIDAALDACKTLRPL